MSVIAGQLSIGPLAAARLQTLAAASSADDERRTPRTARWTVRETVLAAVVAVLLALTVVAAGRAMPRTSPEHAVGTPDEVFVVDPDGEEPFIVCTVRAGIRRCSNLDLLPAQP
jgi:hypothetical protein